MQLKNQQSTNSALENRINELIRENEQYKLSLGERLGLENKAGVYVLEKERLQDQVIHK